MYACLYVTIRPTRKKILNNIAYRLWKRDREKERGRSVLKQRGHQTATARGFDKNCWRQERERQRESERERKTLRG